MNERKPLFSRFLTYQKERYPFLGYVFLVGAFSFSAIAYSRLCRGLDDFVDWPRFAVCVFNTVTLFFLVRVFDEFKDKEEDAKYRQYLPVPRGLISLQELKVIGIVTFCLQLIVTGIFYPDMLYLFAIAIGYLLLMGKEFFIASWLKKHQFWYVVSHMMIIPLIDVFASGFDWYLEDVQAPVGLVFFFAVSFMNGVVLEIGRKIKTPETEEEGVLSYTSMLGTTHAVWFWLLILLLTLVLASVACMYAGHGSMAYTVLSLLFVACAIPAVSFINKQTVKSAKMIEYASALWTFGMYLTLGGIPMLLRLITH